MALRFLPAVSASGFACFIQKLFNQLGSLHFIEVLHGGLIELLGEVLDVSLVHLVFIDDAKNKTLLTLGAVP